MGRVLLSTGFFRVNSRLILAEKWRKKITKNIENYAAYFHQNFK